MKKWILGMTALIAATFVITGCGSSAPAGEGDTTAKPETPAVGTPAPGTSAEAPATEAKPAEEKK